MIDVLMIFLAVIAMAFLIFIGYAIAIFNGLVALKNNMKKSWANIDVLLKQRADELPKLMDTVKGYMGYEKNLLEKITNARTSFMNAKTVKEKASADREISGVLKTIFAVAENYPNLKANENFSQLQSRISGLESEIADRREFYNESVNNYNIRIQSFPDAILANIMGMKEADMFKVAEDEKKDVKIQF